MVRLNIKLIGTRCEQARKAHQRFVFLPVPKARTNKFYIFRQCRYIVYLFLINIGVVGCDEQIKCGI